MAKRRGAGNNTKSTEVNLYGFTPVQQCLLHKSRPCRQVFIKEGKPSERIKQIIQLAKEHKVQIQEVDTHHLGSVANTRLHQGVVAVCDELNTYDLASYLDSVYNESKQLIIAFDQLEDPQNVGAIIRTSAFLGASAILTLKNNAAPLNATVSKASAGALEYFPIIQVGNLSESLIQLKKEAFEVFGASSDDSIDYREVNIPGRSILIMGNEGQGLRNLTQKRCDQLIHISGSQSTESLNVSAASAILIQHFTQSIFK
jgi:23S rRNA (guanosine2251-2'-O)-methyltransferase